MFTTNCVTSLCVVGPAVPEAELVAVQLLSPTVWPLLSVKVPQVAPRTEA